MNEYQISKLLDYRFFMVSQLVDSLRAKGFKTYQRGNPKLFSEASLEQIKTTIDELA